MLDILGHPWTKLDKNYWTLLDILGHFWTLLDIFGHCLTILDILGLNWTKIIGHCLTSLDIFGHYLANGMIARS
ncbi:MAG: hypothetical protein OER82_03830 [Nitrosopumilus sp.]|nr:hypothetical protein [Nitrosopumilus sp.]